jgi:hypothetical protein
MISRNALQRTIAEILKRIPSERRDSVTELFLAVDGQPDLVISNLTDNALLDPHAPYTNDAAATASAAGAQAITVTCQHLVDGLVHGGLHTLFPQLATITVRVFLDGPARVAAVEHRTGCKQDAAAKLYKTITSRGWRNGNGDKHEQFRRLKRTACTVVPARVTSGVEKILLKDLQPPLVRTIFVELQGVSRSVKEEIEEKVSHVRLWIQRVLSRDFIVNLLFLFYFILFIVFAEQNGQTQISQCRDRSHCSIGRCRRCCSCCLPGEGTRDLSRASSFFLFCFFLETGCVCRSLRLRASGSPF